MIELHNVECLEFMRGMPDNSVDAIVTDPPYFGVKDDDWDNQWKDADAFIAWIGELSEQWQRILKPNGSLYVFASPKMAARVEVKIAERFEVLQNIVWHKGHAGRGQAAEKEAFRNWWPGSERIIFAEHYGADNIAKGEAGYVTKCDELRGFVFEPLRAYLDGERKAVNLQDKEARARMGLSIKGGGLLCHFWGGAQWMLPTLNQYTKLQEAYPGHFTRHHEDLRREYEDLRRPFNVTADDQYTDVWTFRTVQAYDGKHVCEKPIALMEHIILASTKPDAIVFDPFMGSGSTGVACVLNGRSFIGCEKDPKHFANASTRIRKHQAQPRLFDAPAPQPIQLTL